MTLQDLASKKHEWVEISVDEDDATKLTYGEMFRRFAIALDECASRNDIDAGLQTHLMGHVYKKHIDALEKRRPTKKREKEAQKIDGHLDAKPRKRALGARNFCFCYTEACFTGGHASPTRRPLRLW